MEVVVRGLTFRSVQACAKHFGLHQSTVYEAIKRGRQDTIGLGTQNVRQPMRVSVRGQIFETVQECADHFGLSAKTVYSAIYKGKEDKLGLRSQLMKVTIRGKTYKTVELAAKKLGVSRETIYGAIERGRLDYVGLGAGKGPRPNWRGGRPKRPIKIGGVHFDSMSDLARFVGMDRRHINAILHSRGAQSKSNLEQKVMLLALEKDKSERDAKTEAIALAKYREARGITPSKEG